VGGGAAVGVETTAKSLVSFLLRRIVLCFLLCFAAWAAGLVWFIGQLPIEPSQDSRKADAVVVLTGGSARLDYGLQLLAEGKGDRLFISGVSERFTTDDILRHVSTALRQRLPAQAIFLGHTAENTIGNAEETARWLQKNHCKTIRLVTANYHMPRSIREFEDAAPGITIIPAPVFPDDFAASQWWKHTDSRHLLLSEYHKYIASRLRHWVVSATRR
jgi:uncharacterized SAM-binding protein YcdF (DUF218 family)